MSTLTRTKRSPRRVGLPAGFIWMKHLDSAEQAAFIGGMLTRVLSASVSDNWSAVSDWVEEWKATANIYADPQATHAVKVGKKELANSNWVDWLSLKKELGL